MEARIAAPIEIESNLSYCNRCKVHGNSFDSYHKKRQTNANPATLHKENGFKRNVNFRKDKYDYVTFSGSAGKCDGEDRQWRKVISANKSISMEPEVETTPAEI